jgi:hypothetical protein
MLAALYFRGGWKFSARSQTTRDNSARRYVIALAFGPFLVTTIIAAVLGRLPIAMWGYPLWSFLPLAIIMLVPPPVSAASLRNFARAYVVFFSALLLGYVAIEGFEPLLRDRRKATQFPGRVMAETITQQWRQRTGTPLIYAGGSDMIPRGAGEFPANNLAVYSPDRPHVIVHGDLRLSPWVDPTDLARRGAVFVWEMEDAAQPMPADLRAAYPNAEFQPPLVLPRHTIVPRRPVLIGFAFLLPQP